MFAAGQKPNSEHFPGLIPENASPIVCPLEAPRMEINLGRRDFFVQKKRVQGRSLKSGTPDGTQNLNQLFRAAKISCQNVTFLVSKIRSKQVKMLLRHCGFKEQRQYESLAAKASYPKTLRTYFVGVIWRGIGREERSTGRTTRRSTHKGLCFRR